MNIISFLHCSASNCSPGDVLASGLVAQYACTSLAGIVLCCTTGKSTSFPPEQCYSRPPGVNLIDGPLQYMLFLVVCSNNFLISIKIAVLEPDLPTTTPWIMFAVSCRCVLHVCVCSHHSVYIRKGEEKHTATFLKEGKIVSSLFYIKRLKAWMISLKSLPCVFFFFHLRPCICLCFLESRVLFSIFKASTRDHIHMCTFIRSKCASEVPPLLIKAAAACLTLFKEIKWRK